jgi:hypothetical protein
MRCDVDVKFESGARQWFKPVVSFELLRVAAPSVVALSRGSGDGDGGTAEKGKPLNEWFQGGSRGVRLVRLDANQF